MNDQIKNGLGVAAAIALLGGAIASFQYVNAYSRSIEPTSFRSFSVSGEGKVVTIPDIARFSFSVVTEGGKDVGALQTENTNKVNKSIEFVKSKGVEAKDIATEGYGVEPRYQYFNCNSSALGSGPCPPPQIVGYTVRQTVSVKVRDFTKDFTKIGDILSGVVREGANSVSGPSFDVDDPEKARAEARDKAIAQARAKAEEVARAGGFGVGRLLGLQEGGFEPIYGRGGYDLSLQESKVGSPAPAPSPSIEPGSQDIRVTVTLQYEIK